VSRDVFVDAGAWIAVSDVGDKYHNAAREEYNRLIGDRRTFVTTNLVIAEAYIIIRRTGGYAQAMTLLRSLRGSPRLLKIHSDAKIESMAEDILERYTDQDFSYADAISFVVMQERGIEEAFTFDSHFATMGFQMVPTESA
jgi:hypothetical protein